jgi:ketosteroid isomerase-like protein
VTVAAVSALVYAYAECIDAGDFAGVADLLAGADLTADGQAEPVRGREAVLRRYERTTRRYADGTPLTRHLTTNLVVDVDDGAGTASARSSYTVLQAVPPDFPLQPIIAGRYRDRFTRVGGEWRFAARHIAVDLIGDLSRHLLFELPAQ